MTQEFVSQSGDGAPARARFDELCALIAVAQPPPSAGFMALLEMRIDQPFAAQDLAALISHDPEFHSNLQASHIASTLPRPAEQPFSAREVIDHWGYRIIHSCSVANGIVKFLDDRAFAPEYHQFWINAFVSASYAGVLAEVLESHEDRAFSGSLLRSAALFLLERQDPSNASAARLLAVSSGSPLWEAQADLIGGSYFDLARRLARRFEAGDSLIEIFDPIGPDGSLADLLLRATAAAERHGFRHPTGPTFPPSMTPEREPILDTYFARSGGTTASLISTLNGMLALTPLRNLDSAA